VQTAVDLISHTCILDNAVFLRRVADVETDNGDNAQTYRDGYHGGIWNVSLPICSRYSLTINKSKTRQQQKRYQMFLF